MTSSFFTFKPQQQLTKWDASVKNVLWTQERATLPPTLAAAGVDLATWQTTFDKVVEQYQFRYNGVNFTTRLPVVNIAALPYNVGSRVVYENRWRKLAQVQAEIYKEYGIKIQLMQSLERRSRMTTVGLSFEHVNGSPGIIELAEPVSASVVPGPVTEPLVLEAKV